MIETNQIKTNRQNCLTITCGWVLALVLATSAIGLLTAPAAHAQSTSGSITGHAPAGDTIIVKGSGGVRRNAKVKENGRYAVRGLPLGAYSVILLKDGNEMDAQSGVRLRPGGSLRVDFDCKDNNCAKHDKSGSS